MAASAQFAVGSHVWVEDPDIAWIDGEVVGVKGKEIEVKCTSGKKIVVKVVNAYPKDPEFPPSGVEDMTRLAYLHEPGVLLNLNCRYDRDEIYTYTGNILIAVNPFKRIARMYEKDLMEQYQGRALGELSPHPFAVADSSYRQMIDEGISQSILVSGESGAGKTESTKMLMQYLAYMGGKRSVSEGQSVEQQVLESNPVLEAFGNAKTVRNNNSSRFGKFVELQFDQRGRITGAAIRTYLLERSRVCQVSDPERNYHCFYMLCAAPSEDVKKYKLGNPRTYHYLNQSTFFELDGLDDSKEYLVTRKAMDVVGINSEEQDAIFRVVAAILHLGNVEFAKGENADSSVPKDDKSRQHLKNASELFMCDKKALEDSLCKRVIVTRDESITKSLDPHTATLNRDALAKIVYSRLFDWIVSRINESIGQDPDSKVLIGILDIYGFESFKTNSFEQFCINLTNEKLQQHFNQHVFKMEQEEYTKEEIDWSYVEFIDNKDILDLIEKKPGGVIALLDEACMFPRSTHETFAQKLYQTFKDHKRFSKPKLSQTDFTICHYAGDVTYQTDLFLDKNKDYVVAEHQALLNASKCPFVSSLFPRVAEESAKSSKFSSIGSRCKQQLQTLLETLNATEPHYIRCVKPNNLLKPNIFENFNVLQQLRCGGVLEAIRISCAGFPTRKTFDEFLSRFKILEPSVVDGSCNEITACKKILEKANLSGPQIGKTKVFLRAGQMAELDARRAEVLRLSAIIIQRKVCTYFCRKHFIRLQQSSIQIQAFSRGQVARCRYVSMRREAASINIQKILRMHLARKAYNNLCSSAICIQTGMRVMAASKELQFRRQTKAATLIQRHCRGFLSHLHYLRTKKAVICTQCAWRRVLARRELRKLKMAAREAGALKVAKIQLEKEVEDLTSSLELEKQLRADVEKAKTREHAELQSALQKIQLQFQETTDLLIMEQEASKKEVREHAELQSTFQEMQLQFEETKDLLVKEQEASKKEAREHAELQSAFQEIQLQFEETKDMLIKEQEASKKEVREHAELQSAFQEMQLQFEETKDLLIREQEACKKEVREHAELQSAFQEMQQQFEETKDLLIKEQEASKKEAREHAELQSAFQEMQLQFEETKDLLIKEQEVSKKQAEQSPIVHEIPVIDIEIMNKLTAENEELKERLLKAELAPAVKEVLVTNNDAPVVKEVSVTDNEIKNKSASLNEELKTLVSSLETKIDETERWFEETNRISEGRLKQALDAESKIIELKTAMQRLEEKLSDMETEDQILRQQALFYSPSTKTSDYGAVENGHHEAGVSGKMSVSDSRKIGSESKMLGVASKKFDSEKKSFTPEDVDMLINCVTQKLGFTEEKPAATITIYKCLIHWRALEMERTSVFDCLIHMIGSAIENQDDNDHMAYWLSNTSILLFLIQRSITSPRKPPTPTSFFGRMTQSFRSSSSSLQVGAADLVRHVEAKYPALLFKQQLTAYVEKIFGIIRDNLKKELSSLLSYLQAPEGSTGSRPAINNWHKIVDRLNGFLSVLKDNYVPSVLVQNIFTRVFCYINVQLFNSLLLHQEWCTFSNGEHVKDGLAELEIWCGQVNEEYSGSSWDELKHIRQAVGFLVLEQKLKITYDDITNDICPILTVHQLHRLCTSYCNGNKNTDTLSSDVISSMKLLMTDDPDPGDDTTYLLDDNSSIPLMVEDVTKALLKMDFTGVKPAAQLVQNPAFQFLQD